MQLEHLETILSKKIKSIHHKYIPTILQTHINAVCSIVLTTISKCIILVHYYLDLCKNPKGDKEHPEQAYKAHPPDYYNNME